MLRPCKWYHIVCSASCSPVQFTACRMSLLLSPMCSVNTLLWINLKHLFLRTFEHMVWQIRVTACRMSLQKADPWGRDRETSKRAVLNKAEGISSSFNSDGKSSCCFFPPSFPPSVPSARSLSTLWVHSLSLVFSVSLPWWLLFFPLP